MDLREFYTRFSLDESLVEGTGHNPYYLRIDSGLNEKIRVNGQEMIDLASNNYLGLTTDSRVKQAAIEAVQKYDGDPRGFLPCVIETARDPLALICEVRDE